MNRFSKLNLAEADCTGKEILDFLRFISRDPQKDRVKVHGNDEYVSAFDPMFLNICWRLQGYYEDKLDRLLEKYVDQDREKIDYMDHGQQEVPVVWTREMLMEKLSLQGMIFCSTGLYAYRDTLDGSGNVADGSFETLPDDIVDFKVYGQTLKEASWNYWGFSYDQNTTTASVEAAKTWMDERYRKLEKFRLAPPPPRD